MVRRERNERYAMVELFANIAGSVAGVDPVKVEGALELYLLELSQDRYRPSVISALRNVRKARRQKANNDANLLKQLDKLTVSDQDISPPPAKGRKRRR